MMQHAFTASKWFLRSLKKGDWIWLMIAVLIASSTVTVVKQVGETLQQSMLRKASQSLGADLVIQSSRPIAAKWQKQAEQMELRTRQSISVVTMAMVPNAEDEPQFQLVNLTGVSQPQPLRGQREVSSLLPFSALDNNSIWVEPKLLSLLPLTPDSKVTLGTAEFTLAGSVKSPQALNPMTGFAPGVWMTLPRFKEIGLIGPGSRVKYKLSVAGTPQQIAAFAKQIKQSPPGHWQILSAEAPSEDLGKSLDTAWLFLDLSALAAVLVAGMSILIASRFYLGRWQNSIALMRAFGANNRKMIALFAWQLSWIAIVSSVLGVLLGYALYWALLPTLGEYFSPLVSAPPFKAMLIGFLSGVLVLWTFAWQAFQSAISTPPIAVLKSLGRSHQDMHWFISFALLLGLVSIMLDIGSIYWIIGGILVVSMVLYLVAMLFLKLMSFLQAHSRGWFKIALSNLTREPGLVKIQLVSLGMVLFVLMAMTFVRQDLLNNWQQSLPDNTPNVFVMNIQPDQKSQVDTILDDVQGLHEAPMVRGRLSRVNGESLNGEPLSPRGQRLLQREANIAVLAKPPAYNNIVASLQSKPKQTTPSRASEWPKVSVEKGIAETFGIELGDILTFNIAGQSYRYQVTTFREVNWQSFRLNFFFIIEPQAERDLPVSYINNFYLPLSDSGQTNRATTLTQQLAQQTPGVLLIDVRQVMQQIKTIMNQASWAVSGLYIFTLLASIAVLFTATLASQKTRIQGWFLLRTLGAKNSTIIKVGLTEFVSLGVMAGLFAASFAQLASLLISHFLLQMPASFSPLLWLSSLLIGALLLLCIGLISQWRYLKNLHRLNKGLT